MNLHRITNNKIHLSVILLLITSVYSKKSLFDIEPKEDDNVISSSSSSWWSSNKIIEEGETILNNNNPRIPQTDEEREEFRLDRYRRMEERREMARKRMKEMIQNPQNYMNDQVEVMSDEEIDSLRDEVKKHDPDLEQEQHRWLWNTNRVNGKNQFNPYNLNGLADPGQYYSEWAQAYRMLGAFIICDQKSYGYYEDGNNQACSRYIMWAAYVDPNYQGNGRNEYFGYNKRNKNQNYYGNGCQKGDDGSYHCYSSNVNNMDDDDQYQKQYTNPTNVLDCHTANTNWELLGIYRQEFYEFFEQVTKHLWYYNDYEYIVAYTGLSYLNDGECSMVGSDYYGQDVYAAPRPLQGGSFEMGLYSDMQCLVNYEGEKNYDEFLGNYYANAEEWGDDDYYKRANAQSRTKEYTMTLFNEVFEEFKYCTLCIDYPSYQDGYFNGDYGTDEDDLINQCWKFYSHDSYHCNYECLSMADAQGTINEVRIGSKYYGATWDGESYHNSYSSKKAYNGPSREEVARANLFFLLNLMLLGFTYYTYQQLGKHRGFDNNNMDRTIESHPKRRRRNKPNNQNNKGKRRGLLYNNRENDLHEGVQKKKFHNKDTPWMDHFENVVAEGNKFLAATVFSPHNKNPRKKNVRKDEASVADSHTQSSKSPDLYNLKRVDPRSLIRSKAEMSKYRGEETNQRRGKTSIFLGKGRGRTTKTGKSSGGQGGGKTAMFMGAQRVRSDFKYEPPKMTKLPENKKKVVVHRNDDRRTLVKVNNNHESNPVFGAQDHFAAATKDYQANSTQERPHFDESSTVKPEMYQSDRDEEYDDEMNDNQMYYSEMHDDETRDEIYDDDIDHDEAHNDDMDHDDTTNHEFQDDVHEPFTKESKPTSPSYRSVSNNPGTTTEESRSPKNDKRRGEMDPTSSDSKSNVRGVYGLKRSYRKKRPKNADITWSNSSTPQTQMNPPPTNTEEEQIADSKESEMAATGAKKKNKAIKGSSAIAAKILERHRNRFQTKKNANISNAPDTVPVETNDGKLLDDEMDSQSSDDSNGHSTVHEYVDEYGEISFVFST